MNRLWLVAGLVALSLTPCLTGCSEPRTSNGGGGGNGGGTGGTGGNGPCSSGAFGETTIYDLQNPLCAPAPKTEVVVKGVVVTAVVPVDGVGQHFFVEAPKGGQYSGIYVRNDHVVEAPKVGDVVDVTGVYDEYFDRSNIEILSLSITGTAEVPAPADVVPEAIATGGADQEAWEGVLVRVADVKVTDAFVRDASGQERGNWRINSSGREAGGVLVGTMMNRETGYVREPADLFSSIVGVLDYGFEESKLEPRTAADLTFADGTHPRLTEAGEKTVYELQDSWSLSHPHAPANVVVKDVVVTANAGTRIWVQELGGGDWSGIQVRLAEGAESPAVGSKVTVSGVYTEYFSTAQIETAVVETTGEAELPALATVTPADLRTGSAEAERWEGVPVEILDVKNVEFQVKGSDNTWRGDFRVAPIEGGTEGAIVGHVFADDYLSVDGDEQPDEFLSIAGIVDYSFSEYRLETRGNEDIVFLDGTHPTAPDVGTTTIQQIQDESRPDYAGTNVIATVENVVVTAASSQGFFVQMPAGEAKFSGLYVYVPSATGLTPPARGAQVSITGKIYEYYGKTQMELSALEITGAGTIPSPAVVDAAAIATGGVEQEAYEGVLVQVRDVENTQDPVTGTDGQDRGDFRVGPAGSGAGVVVGHLFADDYSAGKVGDAFDSLTGVMDYSFDEARLETRDNADVTFADGTHPQAAGLTVTAVQDATNALHPQANANVLLPDVVVTGVLANGSFFVADRSGGPWSGIYVFKRGTVSVPAVAVGDVVTVTGVYKEYYTLSEIEVSSVTPSGATAALPAPSVLTPDELTDAATAEAYEGCLVTVEDVVVTLEDAGFGAFRVQTAPGDGDPSDDLLVDDLFSYTRSASAYASITGLLDYSFDNYRLMPRGDSDLVVQP